jgi:hypothetical protein
MNTLTRIKRRMKKGKKYGNKNSTNSFSLPTVCGGPKAGFRTKSNSNTSYVTSSGVGLKCLKFDERYNCNNRGFGKHIQVSLQASLTEVRDLAFNIECTATVLRLQQEKKAGS